MPLGPDVQLAVVLPSALFALLQRGDEQRQGEAILVATGRSLDLDKLFEGENPKLDAAIPNDFRVRA
jgi:hypothetical protein